MKPFIKWAGGKTQLLSTLSKMIPDEYGTYFEPFLGGGALYLYLSPKKAVLNDYNEQLINAYEQIKHNSKELIKGLRKLETKHLSSDDYYLKMRKKYNDCLKRNELSLNSACLFIYLNKTGYNGLYRLNANGLFNVPSAHRKKISLYDEDNIKEISNLLKNAKIYSKDFEESCKNAKEGDFVFFDSPYYNTFDGYQAGGFDEEDHKRLAKLFKSLTKKRVKCLLTNSNEKFITDLYKGFKIKTVSVKRMINCDGNKRNGEEVIIKNY